MIKPKYHAVNNFRYTIVIITAMYSQNFIRQSQSLNYIILQMLFIEVFDFWDIHSSRLINYKKLDAQTAWTKYERIFQWNNTYILINS